jgi:hypothetical protein
VAPRRWLLLSLAILSLVLLVIGGVVLAYSVPVTDSMVQAARLPGDAEPTGGERAVALPAQDLPRLPTLVAGGGSDPLTGRPGALLVVADGSPDFPASARNASVVRALAYVAPDANGSYASPTLTLHNLTRVEGGNVTTYDATVEVNALALGKKGFLVKADAEDTIRFVEETRVVGQLQGYVLASSVYWFLLSGGIGFLVPIAYLILTHRPTGTKGLPGGVAGVTGACPECRAPVPPGQGFCTRCGAWVSKKEGGS